jgi:hypothetical protein
MKTQINPQRPSLYGSNVLETAIKSGKTFYRPNSQKKLSKNMWFFYCTFNIFFVYLYNMYKLY